MNLSDQIQIALDNTFINCQNYENLSKMTVNQAALTFSLTRREFLDLPMNTASIHVMIISMYYTSTSRSLAYMRHAKVKRYKLQFKSLYLIMIMERIHKCIR